MKKVCTFNAPDPLRRFTAEARILTCLLQQDVPVAVPVLANDGKAYATADEGTPYAVFPMLPSGGADDDLGLDPALFQNVGAAIARLHVALASCPYGVESWQVGPGLLKNRSGFRRHSEQERFNPALRLTRCAIVR